MKRRVSRSTKLRVATVLLVGLALASSFAVLFDDRRMAATRVLALLESEGVTREQIERLAARHGLSEAWRRFATRFLDE